MRKRLMAPTLAAICASICAGLPAWAQTTLTWEEVKARFETANPTLRAGQLNISESKAQETTAYLKPNPSMTVSVDQFEPFSGNPYRPFGSLLPLRPIMMTALVACFGLLPAAMSTGIGSDSQKPFAIVIVAGLASRLLLSIFLSPVLYSLAARDGDTLQV